MTGFYLKIIAIITMLIDHIGYIFITNPELNLVFRGVGRLAFPIFAFLVAEGCSKTSDIKKYMYRLLVFAFISEIPFDFAFTGSTIVSSHQNVFFTLFLGVTAIYFYEIYKDKNAYRYIFTILPAILALLLKTDYGAEGVLFIFLLYYMRGDLKKQIYIMLVGNLFIYMSSHPIQLVGFLAIIPVYFYNGERGKNNKYIFYIFYPLHLLVLGLLQL